MTLWFVFALMTAAAVLAVLWPLAFRVTGSREGSEVNVYRDQLDEIERDRASGLIGATEAEAARVEVSRRLLASAEVEATIPLIVHAGFRRRAVAVLALGILPIGAIVVYLTLGSPGLPGQALASRTVAPSANAPMESLLAQVEARLARAPDDGRGWDVVAPVYLRTGRFADAVKARRNAIRFAGETSTRQAGLGEALTAEAGGVVTADAKAAFERALALDGEDPGARYFLGLAAEQDGRPQEAASIWRTMLARAPAGAPWVEFVRGALARLEPGTAGPNAEDVAAASGLSEARRSAMVQGMVERLAERMKVDGANVDGWLRLVRSYMVLGEREKALTAVDDARRALDGDPEKLKQLDALVKGLGLEG